MLLLKEWFSNNLGFRAHILKVLIGLIYYSVGTSVKGYWPIAISGFLIIGADIQYLSTISICAIGPGLYRKKRGFYKTRFHLIWLVLISISISPCALIFSGPTCLMKKYP